MANDRAVRIQKVIDSLNAVGVGDLRAIRSRVASIEADLVELQIEPLRDAVGGARAALERGNVPEFRRLLSQAVSRLGHLR